MAEKDGSGGMISNVYMKHAKVSLERPKKVDRARVAAVIIFIAVMLGICILPQILYGTETPQCFKTQVAGQLNRKTRRVELHVLRSNADA